MQFQSSHTAFGRNETFGLRYAWIPKGYESYRNDPAIFSDESATVKLGLGKNMVQSMRYWMQAYGIIDSERGISSFAEVKNIKGLTKADIESWLINNPELAEEIYRKDKNE